MEVHSYQKTKLIFFTNTYPYGLGEQWKANEINTLHGLFREVIIVPFHDGGQSNPVSLPENVRVLGPLFDRSSFKLSLADRLSIFRGTVGYFLKEFFGGRAFMSKDRFNNWNRSAFQITQMLHHPVVIQLLKENLNDAVFYFYWGIRQADLVPFFRRRFSNASFYVRFHGFDLYEERNRGYIPFRRQVLSHVNAAIAISDYGEEYLERYKSKVDFRIIKNRLGVKYAGKAQQSSDGVLRVVSCASLIPLKRVHLIYEALILVNIPIEWKHIGDGELMEDLKKLIAENPSPNVKVELMGRLSPKRVMESYVDQQVDLFLHVSETEGVPVSIMEALSASIPVIATDAGGTRELVNTACGWVIPVNFKPYQLATRVLDFYELDKQKKEEMRAAAYGQYEKMCNAEENARALADELIK